jgi:aminoglycoside phosphotransferase (APT) family kinase protein
VASDVVITDLQERIVALLADDPSAYLPETSGGWRRVFGRVQPDAAAWAVLAYEPRALQAGSASAWSAVLVEVFAAGGGGEAAVPHTAGDLVITSIADDPELPGLRRLLDDHAAATLLRYRPHRRCTLKITERERSYIVKVLPDDRGEQFHRDALELWGAAQRGALDFDVAEPIRWDSATMSTWQGIVPGAPLAPALLRSGGHSIAERMGAALGTLARSNVRPSTTITSTDQMQRTGRAVENAVRRVPEIADDLHQILDTFKIRHASLSPDRLVPVHGAPHMHQWLIDNETNRLGLIDFDRFALGEIELDIATLLVELDYEDELAESPADIENAVVAGFRSAGLDVDRSRLRLYTAHKRMSKITREAWALRTNGERRARRHLPRIIEDLTW